jgi:hypothetical protein
MKRLRLATALFAALTVVVPPAWAITLGTVDTFQDGLTAGWTSGNNHPTPPVVVTSGGPEGADDAYLLVRSSGTTGAGGKLLVFATGTQWKGNYTQAGVTGLTMDVNNLGNTDLSLRLHLMGTGGLTADSLAPIFVPAGSGWTAITFSLDPADLSGAAAAVLGDLTEFRLFHAVSDPYPPAVPIAATLGIDNVTAVPEVSSALMFGAGLATLAGMVLAPRRRQQKAV